jgi:hypothetical protein
MHDGFIRGRGGLKCFKGKKLKLKLILFYFYVFKKNSIPPPPSTLAGCSVALQSPRPHGRAVEHDGSCMGAGGL